MDSFNELEMIRLQFKQTLGAGGERRAYDTKTIGSEPRERDFLAQPVLHRSEQ